AWIDAEDVLGDSTVIGVQAGGLLMFVSTDTGLDAPLHGGADVITSGSGNDTVVGGPAGDTIDAGDGNNVVFGDSGELDYQSGTGDRKSARLNASSRTGADAVITGME